jgi:hypothetical protein
MRDAANQHESVLTTIPTLGDELIFILEVPAQPWSRAARYSTVSSVT